MLLLSLVGLATAADVPDPPPDPAPAAVPAFYRSTVMIGVGSHFGVVGAEYVVRATPAIDLALGAGMNGVAGALRVTLLPRVPLFATVGFSPGIGDAGYAPDVGGGLELRRDRWTLLAGLGVALPQFWLEDRPPQQVTLDVGAGYAIGTPRGGG